MVEQEDLLEVKQEYLTKEIVVDDQEDFINYCSSKKENGSDLDKWELDELKEIVVEFKKSRKFKLMRKNTEALRDGIKNVALNSSFVQEKKESKHLVKCRKANPTNLNLVDNIYITVDNPILVETGIFTSNYVLYDIRTLPLGWFVRRRFSDFETLRVLMLKYYPGHVLPPLPKKKIGNRRFEDDYLMKRMDFLCKFLNVIIESSLLRTSEILTNFLSQNDRTVFDKKTKELILKSEPMYIDEYFSIEGEIQLNYDEDNDRYFNTIKEFSSLNKKLLIEINNHCKAFDKSILEASASLVGLQKHLTYLSDLYKKINFKESYSLLFKETNDFIGHFAKIISKQSDCFKHDFKEYFKYVRLENECYDEVLKQRDLLRDQFNVEKKRLDIKKEKLWAAADFNRWEFADNLDEDSKVESMKTKEVAFKHMCYKETNQVRELYSKLGYFNLQSKDEFKKMICGEYERTKKSVKLFLDIFYSTITESVTTWCNFGMNLDMLE